MILSDRDIKKAIEKGRIVITPYPDFDEQLSSCLMDLRLGDTFRVYQDNQVAFIDPADKTIIEQATKLITVKKGDAFMLRPGEFVLGITVEQVEIPDDLTARLEGRSSLGRLGVVIHSTASNIECGFRGRIVLELSNIGKIPVKLLPGMRICALTFETLSSPAEKPYYKKKNAQYLNQKKP